MNRKALLPLLLFSAFASTSVACSSSLDESVDEPEAAVEIDPSGVETVGTSQQAFFQWLFLKAGLTKMVAEKIIVGGFDEWRGDKVAQAIINLRDDVNQNRAAIDALQQTVAALAAQVGRGRLRVAQDRAVVVVASVLDVLEEPVARRVAL
ncbi:MAG: hypothetical protein EOP08_10705, partial [Proteobacteria bacterium]